MSRQIQANSRGDRDETATTSARQTLVVFTAERKQNASQRSDRLTFTRYHLGIVDNGAALTSARIETESRLANLPIYVYDLRDYKPLNLGSTDPIALSIGKALLP